MTASFFSRRRRLLQGAAASLGVAALPQARSAPAGMADAFAANTFGEAIVALGGVPVPSTAITLDLPAVVDNGAVVPVTMSTTLPGVREMLIVVDGNPIPMAARFTIPAGTEPFVATRIRMAGSGTVYAAVRTESGLFAVARSASVTVGGCG